MSTLNSNIYKNLIKEKVDELLSIKNITNGWKQQSKGDLFTHSTIKYCQLELPLNKIEGTFPTSYEKTVHYFQNCHENKERNEMCGTFDITKQIDDNTFIGHLLNKGKFIFSPRELIVVQNKYDLQSDEALITRISINDHESVTSDANAVRADAKIYGIYLKKLNDYQTQIEAYLIVDLKGNIPNFANNMMIEKYFKVFESDISYIKSH